MCSNYRSKLYGLPFLEHFDKVESLYCQLHQGRAHQEGTPHSFQNKFQNCKHILIESKWRKIWNPIRVVCFVATVSKNVPLSWHTFARQGTVFVLRAQRVKNNSWGGQLWVLSCGDDHVLGELLVCEESCHWNELQFSTLQIFWKSLFPLYAETILSPVGSDIWVVENCSKIQNTKELTQF